MTEPKQAASALQWAVSEMERRLKVFERLNVRKISTYNEKQAAGEFEHYDNPPQKMPYLVIIIDELSDLMMVAGKDVEARSSVSPSWAVPPVFTLSWLRSAPAPTW